MERNKQQTTNIISTWERDYKRVVVPKFNNGPQCRNRKTPFLELTLTVYTFLETVPLEPAIHIDTKKGLSQKAY